MRYYLLTISFILLLIFGCGSNSNTATMPQENEIAGVTANDTVRIANDSLEYEVIIIDPGFNSWLYSRARQRGFYGQQYLENKNWRWVNEWNIRSRNPQRFGNMYQMEIDYRRNINYGYEVNYLLYNYLVYFQNTNNQNLGGIVPQY
ncbi:DUF6146 family protein [Flavobacterium rhizosphaerae]|uniref:DUF6146 family protein n=1 Tax=Flavobacterium rhizosphaerae TaxID=3163298 RepID=A0ABW8YUM3_9FLAO